jgi:DNA polymerase IV
MSDPPIRRILLADADTFYVAVARLVDPAGAGRAKLLIVGGSAEHRGVVTSASYEARAYGVHSAMPMARAMRLCPGALVVPVPWEACGEKSEQVREVLERFTPAVERASSDEFYVDLTGTESLYAGESLADTARRIRAAVQDATSLSVSIGGGTSKLIAKLAAGDAKPGAGRPGKGVHVVDPGMEGEFMRRFTLADIPGVGPRAQERLAKVGLRTVDDVLARDRRVLVAQLGEREGEWLYDCVRGVSHGVVESRREPKSISRDETFPTDLERDEELEAELRRLVDRATSDMREGGLAARTITVKLRDADFTTRQAGRTVPEPVVSDRVVFAVARELLAKLRAARRTPARLLGVALSQFLPQDGAVQLGLLDGTEPLETERDRVTARTIDQLRERFGPDAVARGRTRNR